MSVAQERATGPAALQRRGRFRPGDAVLYVVSCAAALTGVVLLGLISHEVLTQAWPAMQKFGLGFLTTQAWGDKGNTLFGAKSFIFGTVVTSLGALLLATPISLAIALFLSELAPRGVEPQVNLDMAKFNIDLLGVLEEKTKGNLSPDEQKLLDTALYETRMRYVQVASQYATV